MNTLYIIGEISTAIEIRETAMLYYKDIYKSVINIVPDSTLHISTSQIKDSDFIEQVNNGAIKGDFIIGLTDPEVRMEFKKSLDSLTEVNIIHPNSFIMKSATIGKGNYIAANTVISSNAIIGDSNIINFNVTVGHDSNIGNFNTFNPGVRISGNVSIGNNVLIGANSFVYQGVKISDNNLIDAMTYINTSMDENMMSSSKGILKSFKRKNIR